MLDPVTEYIIFKQDVKEGLSEFALSSVGITAAMLANPAAMAAAYGATAVLIIYTIIKLEKEMKKTPRCRNIKTQPEFDICRFEDYIKIYQKEINVSKGKISSCAKEKNPDKCKKVLTKIIQRAEKEIASRKALLVKLYVKKKEKDAKRRAKGK